MSHIRLDAATLHTDPKVKVYTHQGVSYLVVTDGAANMAFDGPEGVALARGLAAVLAKGADDLEAEISREG